MKIRTRPLADTPQELPGRLLAGCACEPPEHARERIARAIADAHAPLAFASGTEPEVAALLRQAQALEPGTGSEQRVWKRLRAGESRPSASRPRVLRPLPLGMLAASALGVAALAAWPQRSADVEQKQGLQIAQAEPLQADDAARVDGVGRVNAGEGTRWSREALADGGVRLVLETGALLIDADPRRPQAPLIVVAGEVQVRVVGTVFSVERGEAGVQVEVRSGRVEVAHAGHAILLGAGERWSSAPADETGPLRNEVAASPLAPKRQTRAKAKAPPREPEIAEVDRRSPIELREAIRLAQKKGEPDVAADALRALAGHPSETRQGRTNALAALAELLDEELGRPAEAIEVWQSLADRDPAGRAAARLGVLHVRLEQDESEAALAAAAACLRDCDTSGRVLAGYVRARLLQRGGELDEARAAIEEARRTAGRPDAEQAASRTFLQRARRLHAAGQTERARAAARFSLTLDPRGAHAAEARRLAGE